MILRPWSVWIHTSPYYDREVGRYFTLRAAKRRARREALRHTRVWVYYRYGERP